MKARLFCFELFYNLLTDNQLPVYRILLPHDVPKRFPYTMQPGAFTAAPNIFSWKFFLNITTWTLKNQLGHCLKLDGVIL